MSVAIWTAIAAVLIWVAAAIKKVIAQDMQAIIQTLVESGQIKESVDGKNKRWYETT